MNNKAGATFALWKFLHVVTGSLCWRHNARKNFKWKGNCFFVSQKVLTFCSL